MSSLPTDPAPVPATATPDADAPHRRGIRSYVLRRSHFSAAQRDAWERLMPVFGLPYREQALDYPQVFGRQAPVVLMNTAIAKAQDPVMMARAMKAGVEAGRLARLAGRMPRKYYAATPSSPTEGLLPSVAR